MHEEYTNMSTVSDYAPILIILKFQGHPEKNQIFRLALKSPTQIVVNSIKKKSRLKVSWHL